MNSSRLREDIADYIDCESWGLPPPAVRTLDSRIWKARASLNDKYGINVLRYKALSKNRSATRSFDQ